MMNMLRAPLPVLFLVSIFCCHCVNGQEATEDSGTVSFIMEARLPAALQSKKFAAASAFDAEEIARCLGRLYAGEVDGQIIKRHLLASLSRLMEEDHQGDDWRMFAGLHDMYAVLTGDSTLLPIVLDLNPELAISLGHSVVIRILSAEEPGTVYHRRALAYFHRFFSWAHERRYATWISDRSYAEGGDPLWHPYWLPLMPHIFDNEVYPESKALLSEFFFAQGSLFGMATIVPQGRLSDSQRSLLKEFVEKTVFTKEYRDLIVPMLDDERYRLFMNYAAQFLGEETDPSLAGFVEGQIEDKALPIMFHLADLLEESERDRIQTSLLEVIQGVWSPD